MAKRRKAKVKALQPDFAKVLALPERLAQYLRVWFHLSKSQWDFALDKLRQYKNWQDPPNQKPVWIWIKGQKKLSRSGPAYFEYSKSKGRGKGRRYFAPPCDELAVVQKAILNRFLSQVTVHFCRYGGQKGSSIVGNAEFHSQAKAMFAVDIVNAYPSVFRSRVQAVLRKPFSFGLRQFAGIEWSEADVELMLGAVVDLLVWKDRIPQGPPTSPRLFDIVCGKMDQQLYELIHNSSTPFQTYKLSVWTDNIAVSSDGEIPEALREAIVKVITGSRFVVHTRDDKMKYYSPETGEVPVITGLVILSDGRTAIAPRKVNQLRARMTNLLRHKDWDKHISDPTAAGKGSTARAQAAGLVGFIRQVYPGDAKLPAKLRKLFPEVQARLTKRPEPEGVTPDAEVPASA